MIIRKILLIRTDRIGDVVLTTPAISILRKQYPQAEIYFLTRAYTAPLLKHYEFLDKIMIYDPLEKHRGLAGHIKFARELKTKNIDLAFLFHPQAGLAFALKWAGITHRVGSGYRWYSIFLNHRVFEHRKHGLRHELEYNLSLIKTFVNVNPKPDEIQFSFRYDENLKKLQNNALNALQINSNYAIVHPGSGGSAPRLSSEMFGRIVKYISENSDLKIILSGSGNEKYLLDEIEQLCGNIPVIKTAGKWNLETYMAVIAGCRLFISNSTGPLHIARAYNIPLVAFYCPAIPCSPRRWGPYNQLDSVLIPSVKPCKDCKPEKCPYGNCLDKISWEDIKALLDKKIKTTGSS